MAAPPASVGSAASAGAAAGSRYPPRNPDPVPATAAIDFGYGLDPRAFAFDPLDPAPPPQPVAKVSGGSEVDGQQSSYVTTGDANADADADAAGEAGSVGGASALGDTAEGSAGEAGAAVTATATSANDAGGDAGANKRKRESE